MSNYFVLFITFVFLFYVGIWLGVAMLMATMTEFTNYQNRAYQWPFWYARAFKTLYRDLRLKKSRVIRFFLLHLNEAVFVCMAAMVPPDNEVFQCMSYEERAREMYLSVQPEGSK